MGTSMGDYTLRNLGAGNPLIVTCLVSTWTDGETYDLTVHNDDVAAHRIPCVFYGSFLCSYAGE